MPLPSSLVFPLVALLALQWGAIPLLVAALPPNTHPYAFATTTTNANLIAAHALAAHIRDPAPAPAPAPDPATAHLTTRAIWTALKSDCQAPWSWRPRARAFDTCIDVKISAMCQRAPTNLCPRHGLIDDDDEELQWGHRFHRCYDRCVDLSCVFREKIRRREWVDL
ncbi:MAG: hypothetical protein M1826_000294 [Phylliscum demangeonii]|nr:MAG: hypothetical protein M1826_000294 [Phylliscum demangeonii]